MNSIVEFVQQNPLVKQTCCSDFALLGEPEAWCVYDVVVRLCMTVFGTSNDTANIVLLCEWVVTHHRITPPFDRKAVQQVAVAHNQNTNAAVGAAPAPQITAPVPEPSPQVNDHTDTGKTMGCLPTCRPHPDNTTA